MARNITVTFSDGTNHVYQNAPDDLTPDAVEARAQKDFGKTVTSLDGGRAPATRGTAMGDTSLQFDAGKMVMNVPGSAAHLAAGVGGMIASPVKTGVGIMDLARGAYLSMLPEDMQQHMLKTDPERTQRALATAKTAGNFYADRYGSAQGFLTALQNDPVGVATDVSTLFTGAGGLLKAGATAGGKGVLSGRLQGEGTLAAKAAEAAAPVVGAMRTAGGALSTAGAYTNPLAPVAKVAGLVAPPVWRVIEPYFPGGGSSIKARAYATALNNDPAKLAQMAEMMKQGVPIEQIAVDLGSHELAAIVSRSKEQLPKLARERAAVTETGQANQLAGAQADVNMLAHQALPVATAGLSAPRKAVSQALAGERAGLQGQEATQTAALTAQADAAAAQLAEQQAARTGALTAEQQAAEASLAQQRANLQAGLPEISPEVSGKALGEARAQGLKNVRTEVTGPAYQKAFDLAPEPFNIQSVVDKAKALGQDLMSVLAPNTVPSELSRIQRVFQPPAPPTPALGGGKVSSGIKAPTPETPPAMATLGEAADLNHALSMAYGQVKNARMGEPARVLRDNIDAIRKELHDAIARGAPADAVEAYAAARKLHATEVVDPFYTGQLSKIGQTTRLNQPGLPHEQVVGAALSDIQEAQTFAKTFARDPAAMEVLKNGILDQFRRDVSQVTAASNEVPAKAAKEWLFKHREVVDVYDKAGMKLGAEIERIASQAHGLETAAKGVKEATKAIPDTVKAEFAPAVEAQKAREAAIGPTVKEQFAKENEALKTASAALDFKYVKDLRQKVVADPMTADMALRRMDAPAKSALARGVMQDVLALKDGAKMLEHLTTNEAGIMRVLKAYDPTTAAKVFADAKEMAEITRLIQQTPVGKNALASQQHLADLTKGLPELRAVVEKIQAEIASGKTFDQLAAEGRKLSKSPFDLVTETTGTMPTGVWNTAYNVARLVMNRVKGGLDKKLGAEVAAELLNGAVPETVLAKARIAMKTPAPPTNSLAPRIVIGGIGRDDTRKSNALAPAR